MEAHSLSGSGSETAAFLNGQIRDALGLRSEDLTIGLEVARNLLQRGATADALRVYAGLILCEPMNAAFQTGLANCALAAEEYHMALQAASAVIALAPRDPRGYLISGRACLGLGAFAEAGEDLREAVERGREVRDAVAVEEARRLLDALPDPTREPDLAGTG